MRFINCVKLLTVAATLKSLLSEPIMKKVKCPLFGCEPKIWKAWDIFEKVGLESSLLQTRSKCYTLT